MSERVSVRRDGPIADVRLNRPDKLNALDPAMFAGLVGAGKELARDRSVRAVVLSGEGRAFSAGLDLASFLAQAAGDSESAGANLFVRAPGNPANLAQQVAYIWTSLPVPVIAAVHGVAFGGGLQIALGADIRFATPDARLSIMEIKWGLIPDMTGTQTLRHLVRLDVAKELTFTGRAISGTEAAELGLVTHVSETPRDDAMVLAGEIAGKSPHAVRAAKKLLNTAGLVDLQDGLQLEESLQRSLLGTPNQIEAVHANIEKRAPRFADPEEDTNVR